MIILGIDPSVNNIGLALYNTETKKLQTRVIHPKSKKDNLIIIAQEIVIQIKIFLQKEKIDKLIMEYPQWENSQRGSIAAQKGYTLNLAFLVGYISAKFNCDILIPSVAEWKGQTPKAATELRVKKHLGATNNLTDHEYDSCGLILWFLNSI